MYGYKGPRATPCAILDIITYVDTQKRLSKKRCFSVNFSNPVEIPLSSLQKIE